MNTELKAKWIKALRSGEYEQGQRFLCLDGAYCCLGVLREIQEPGARYHYEGTSELRPEHNGGLTWEQMDHLANAMNDKGVSFSEIADWIETNL